ncbi:MAG: hypothetical protein Q8N59_03420 [bacterium]|nr:hypothetical protein [bacterium]
MAENGDTCRILAERHVSDRILNRFIELFCTVWPSGLLPQDPRATLLRTLFRAQVLDENHYLSGRFLFELKDGDIENIYLTPILTEHARRRLSERFNMRGDEGFIRIIHEINAGRALSRRERRQYEVYKDRTAIRFENRVYILNDSGVIITVLDDTMFENNNRKRGFE